MKLQRKGHSLLPFGLTSHLVKNNTDSSLLFTYGMCNPLETLDVIR